ncbi:MGT family glycosyltransferase [Saccharothrix coeruleofusca]|uniref:macrolide family glycosyltransferase n=1 Tax=Saccharothrix coeruleofusca TaxID=33919 RepID=UPI001AEB6CEE|nr:macrolide family glycosyltransferase [Saccharothrix coeruleofusca]MBP2334988.1 MGT family glycosyltransferase [Saccharothrix coeruleofusca]
MGLLFVTLAGHGHITPTLALVEELAARGHRVDYATGPENAGTVTSAGANWVELPGLRPFRPVGADVMAAWFRHYFAAMRAAYPVLLDRCRTHRPDVICYDATNWPARLVAGELGIPAVRCVPHLASNESFALPVPDAAHVVADDCAEFATRYGVDLDVRGTLDVPEEVNLVFVPRRFQPAGETFDETFHFLGPLLGRRADEPWSPEHPDLPLLYVSLGSIMTDPAFYRACVAAFGDGTWQVAMTAPDAGPVPATVEVRSWFPQPEVLRRAQAFVTHAGMNSTMEALYYGVPLVAVPRTPEQAANADRIQELGLGERLTDVADLRAAVERVSADSAVRGNLDRMRAAIRAGGGARRGAALVGGLARPPGRSG